MIVGLLGSASSIPPVPLVVEAAEDPNRTGGEAEPSKLDTREIRDPVLRAAVETAYEAWARKYPHLVEDWPT